jgi:hypothetical protein
MVRNDRSRRKFLFINQKIDLLIDSRKITIRQEHCTGTIRESLQQKDDCLSSIDDKLADTGARSPVD